MLGLFQKKIKIRENFTLSELKELTKVLIIDDEEPEDIREYLTKEGWKNYYLPDLDTLSNKRLEECHIICIDIMGVGLKLQCDNGMGLVKYIKRRFPEKKIILYSSFTSQNIFDEALDYVDKRIRKQSSLLPFSSAIEELSNTTFQWSTALEYAYSGYQGDSKSPVTISEFNKQVTKSINSGDFDQGRFSKLTGEPLDVASKVASILSLALTFIKS